MVKVFAFGLMPYLEMVEDFYEKYDSAWVTYPNKHYDPKKGNQYYNDYLDGLEFCEQVGFDGIVVNEHHQTPYGLMPSPNITAAALARRTSRAKIAILGNALTLRGYPQRVAEEIAMLDNITGGRIISGFVRGIGAEYHSFKVNPLDSKEIFYEAHDLIVRSWTEKEPFAFHGKYFQFPYVNVWPRPYQEPHPPIWLPSLGSKDTIEFAARNKYVYLQTLSSLKDLQPVFEKFREEANKVGYTASDEQLGWSVNVYVAETDEIAYREAEEHLMFYFDKHFVMPRHFFFPPGYVPAASLEQIMRTKAGLGVPGHFKFQDLVEKGYVIVGSPETVRQRVEEIHKELRFGNMNVHMHFGNMPRWKMMKNIELFGRQVLPHIQILG